MSVALRWLPFCLGLTLFTACPTETTDDAGAAVNPDAGENTGSPGPDGGPMDAGAAGDGGTGANGGVDAGSVPPEHAATTDAGLAYFSEIDTTLMDAPLVNALHALLLGDHIELRYDGLYDAYLDTDSGREGCANIYDFYSTTCWDPEDYCGNYTAEGDCYNREHAWPKSWWGGGEGSDQHQDLIAVIPADGYVNNARGNLPLGEVTAATYTSLNGSLRGTCVQAEADDGCFEPTDSLKGDLARIYFYMAVRYEGQLNCCNERAVDGADIKAWEENVLRAWHAQDPVDVAERTRNERVQNWQGNRNPFVDLPQLVDQISDF